MGMNKQDMYITLSDKYFQVLQSFQYEPSPPTSIVLEGHVLITVLDLFRKYKLINIM